MEQWNKNVKLLRILNDDHDSKFAAIEGEVEGQNGDKQPAVLVLEKTPFHFDEVVKLMQADEQQFKVDFINDVYHKYTVDAQAACNGRRPFGQLSIPTGLFRREVDLHLSSIAVAHQEVLEEAVRADR